MSCHSGFHFVCLGCQTMTCYIFFIVLTFFPMEVKETTSNLSDSSNISLEVIFKTLVVKRLCVEVNILPSKIIFPNFYYFWNQNCIKYSSVAIESVSKISAACYLLRSRVLYALKCTIFKEWMLYTFNIMIIQF